jgi:hypothetical protein
MRIPPEWSKDENQFVVRRPIRSRLLGMDRGSKAELEAAANIVAAGGSLRDVQELAGHASLATTQRYIQGDTAAKRRVVDL